MPAHPSYLTHLGEARLQHRRTALRSLEPCDQLSFHEVRSKEAESVEKPFLEELLRKHRGNISKAADEAGLSRKTVYRLAKRFNVDLHEFR